MCSLASGLPCSPQAACAVRRATAHTLRGRSGDPCHQISQTGNDCLLCCVDACTRPHAPPRTAAAKCARTISVLAPPELSRAGKGLRRGRKGAKGAACVSRGNPSLSDLPPKACWSALGRLIAQAHTCACVRQCRGTHCRLADACIRLAASRGLSASMSACFAQHRAE